MPERPIGERASESNHILNSFVTYHFLKAHKDGITRCGGKGFEYSSLVLNHLGRLGLECGSPDDFSDSIKFVRDIVSESFKKNEEELSELDFQARYLYSHLPTLANLVNLAKDGVAYVPRLNKLHTNAITGMRKPLADSIANVLGDILSQNGFNTIIDFEESQTMGDSISSRYHLSRLSKDGVLFDCENLDNIKLNPNSKLLIHVGDELYKKGVSIHGFLQNAKQTFPKDTIFAFTGYYLPHNHDTNIDSGTVWYESLRGLTHDYVRFSDFYILAKTRSYSPVLHPIRHNMYNNSTGNITTFWKAI